MPAKDRVGLNGFIYRVALPDPNIRSQIVRIAAQRTHTYRCEAGSPVHVANPAQRIKPFSNVIFPGA